MPTSHTDVLEAAVLCLASHSWACRHTARNVVPRRFVGEEFRRQVQPPPERREQGHGSGLIVSGDGSIVSNHQVMEDAEEVDGLPADNRRFKATEAIKRVRPLNRRFLEDAHHLVDC